MGEMSQKDEKTFKNKVQEGHLSSFATNFV